MAPEEKAALLLTAEQSVKDRSSPCYKHHRKKIKSFLPSTERVEYCSCRFHKTEHNLRVGYEKKKHLFKETTIVYKLCGSYILFYLVLVIVNVFLNRQ